jgi:hypothetical protein
VRINFGDNHVGCAIACFYGFGNCSFRQRVGIGVVKLL